MTKGWWRKFGDRAVKECVLTWGDLGVEPERAPAQAVIEESADAVVGGDTEGLKEWRAEDSRYRRTTASDAHFDGARMNTRGDEIHAARAVRNVIRRPCCTKLKTTRSVVYPFQPPGADPHARWCGRGRSRKGPPLSRLYRMLLLQAEIGAKLGIPQPRVSELMMGKIDKFSSDKLIGILAKLGIRFRLVMSPQTKTKLPRVKFNVSMPRAT